MEARLKQEVRSIKPGLGISTYGYSSVATWFLGLSRKRKESRGAAEFAEDLPRSTAYTRCEIISGGVRLHCFQPRRTTETGSQIVRSIKPGLGISTYGYSSVATWFLGLSRKRKESRGAAEFAEDLPRSTAYTRCEIISGGVRLHCFQPRRTTETGSQIVRSIKPGLDILT